MEPTLTALFAFSGLWLMQVVIPGPNFIRISETTLEHSRTVAMKTALGTAAGNCSWCMLAIAGAALMAQDRLLGSAMRVGGAIYFGIYGCQLLYRALKPRPARRVNANALAAFRTGYATAIASPQPVLFFGSVLSTIFPPVMGGSIIAALILIVGAVTLGWYAVVTSLLASPLSRKWYERRRSAIEFLFGIVLLATSAKLISASLDLA